MVGLGHGDSILTTRVGSVPATGYSRTRPEVTPKLLRSGQASASSASAVAPLHRQHQTPGTRSGKAPPDQLRQRGDRAGGDGVEAGRRRVDVLGPGAQHRHVRRDRGCRPPRTGSRPGAAEVRSASRPGRDARGPGRPPADRRQTRRRPPGCLRRRPAPIAAQLKMCRSHKRGPRVARSDPAPPLRVPISRHTDRSTSRQRTAASDRDRVAAVTRRWCVSRETTAGHARTSPQAGRIDDAARGLDALGLAAQSRRARRRRARPCARTATSGPA